MKLQDLLYFLEDEVKRKGLIHKLKNEGEGSEQAQALESVITSFNLHKPPKGVFQKNVLHQAFGFIRPEDCFFNLRLVSKSWRDAVETIRFEYALNVNDTFIDFDRNGNPPVFYPKFAKVFRKLNLNLTSQIMGKWNSVTSLVLNNMKNLKFIQVITHESIILPKFDTYFQNFCEKHQKTMNCISFEGPRLVNMPPVLLPYLNEVHLKTALCDPSQTQHFVQIIDTTLQYCRNIKRFFIYGIENSPPMMQYIGDNFPDKCLLSHTKFHSSLPFKIVVTDKLSWVQQMKYPSKVEMLAVGISDFNSPFDDNWENYKFLIALCTNLKFIRITSKNNGLNLLESQNVINPENQQIWYERIQHFNSIGVKLIDNHQEFDLTKTIAEEMNFCIIFD